MRATLKFQLPDDAEGFKLACNAAAMHSVLWDMDQYLRGEAKHVEPEQRDDVYKIREHLHALLSDEGIEL